MADDELMTFRDVAKLLATKERPLHISTIHRWCKRGVAGIRLSAKRIGGRWYVKSGDLDDFIDTLTRLCRKVDGSQRDHLSLDGREVNTADNALDSLGW